MGQVVSYLYSSYAVQGPLRCYHLNGSWGPLLLLLRCLDHIHFPLSKKSGQRGYSHEFRMQRGPVFFPPKVTPNLESTTSLMDPAQGTQKHRLERYSYSPSARSPASKLTDTWPQTDSKVGWPKCRSSERMGKGGEGFSGPSYEGRMVDPGSREELAIYRYRVASDLQVEPPLWGLTP